MKAITIKQPWASLIALGEKKFETRSWQTHHKGDIAIHAGKNIDKQAFKSFLPVFQKHGIHNIEDLPVGSIIATAQIVKCHRVYYDYGDKAIMETGIKISDDEYLFGNYEKNRYGWELSNVKKLEKPIEAKGKLSLWDWDENK